MSITYPLVSVIVACRDEEKHIGNCLKSIIASDYPSEKIEILIIDGQSEDASLERVQELATIDLRIKIFDNPQKNTPAAFNIGINHAKGNYILILNARHTISTNYISICTNKLEQDKSLGCVGGIPKLTFDSHEGKYASLALASSIATGYGSVYAQTNTAFTDTAAAPMYPSSVLKEVHFFDEAFLRNQDDELSFRLLQKGYRILTLSEANSFYSVRSNNQMLFRQFYQYGFWKILLLKKHKQLSTSRQIFPALLVLYYCFAFPILKYLGFAYVYFIMLLFYVVLVLLLNKGSSISGKFHVMRTILVIHSAYGIGYLHGILSILLLNRVPADRHAMLTR